MSDLTDPGIEPQTSRFDSDVFSHFANQPAALKIFEIHLRFLKIQFYSNEKKFKIQIKNTKKVESNISNDYISAILQSNLCHWPSISCSNICLNLKQAPSYYCSLCFSLCLCFWYFKVFDVVFILLHPHFGPSHCIQLMEIPIQTQQLPLL